MIASVQREVFPYDRSWFRSEVRMQVSLMKLNAVWNELKNGVYDKERNIVRSRELAAMTATARWMYTSALERKETRGMHRRDDFPFMDSKQHYRILSGGCRKSGRDP
ncbi:FAD-binding protein [Priestia megaterium]